MTLPSIANRRIFCLTLLLFGLLLSTNSPVIAQPLVDALLKNHFESTAILKDSDACLLTPYLSYRVDPENILSIDDLMRSSEFITLNEESASFGFVRGTLWLKVNIDPADQPVRNWILDTGTSFPEVLEVYHTQDNHILSHLITGSRVPFTKRPVAFHQFAFPIHLVDGKQAIYLRVQSNLMISLLPRLRTPENLLETDKNFRTYVGLAFGAVIMLVLFSGLTYFTTRDMLFLVSMLLSILLSVFHAAQTGIGQQFLWPDYPEINTYMFTHTGIIMLIVLGWLNRSLLRVADWSPVLDKVLLATIALLVILFILPIIGSFSLLSFILLGACPVVMTVNSIVGWRRKIKGAVYHLIATVLFFIFISYYLLKIYGVIPYNETLQNIEKFEFLSLIMMISLLLVQKIRDEKTSRLYAIASEATKREFLANMSHEVRTPLNAIYGFTQLMFTTELSKNQREYIELIQKSSENMLSIINDILDFSRIESGKLELEEKVFDIREVVANIHSMFTQTAKSKGLELNFNIDSHLPHKLTGDPLRISQILINLVNNAIKFTKKGSVSVSVGLREKTDHDVTVEIEVKDTGIGIPSQVQGSLFDSFTQADITITRKYGGSGLGLAITRDLVEIMGGDIRLESTEGVGTTFFLKIILQTAEEKSTDSSIISHPTPDAISSQTVALDHLKILLVEDNDINQTLASAILEQKGITVSIANHGEEALKMVIINNFDLILMDMQMPVMDGIEATRLIRQRKNLKQIPIIAMTANALRSDLDRCLAAGMNDFVTKPIDSEKLYSVISRWTLDSKITA